MTSSTSQQALPRDRQGNLYIADTQHHRSVKLYPLGRAMTQWGGAIGPGQPFLPWGLARGVQDELYVTGFAAHRLHRLPFLDTARFPLTHRASAVTILISNYS